MADLKKIWKGLGLAVAGSVLSYVIAQVGTLDAGQYIWLMPVVTVVLNMGRKWVTDNAS